MKIVIKTLRHVLVAGLAIAWLPQAMATGVDAGTRVNNTASVDYEVGGVNQTDVNSNQRSFVVDRVLRFTVAEVGSATTEVAPGSTNRVTRFTVTNNSNSTLDFRLDLTELASGSTPAHAQLAGHAAIPVTPYEDNFNLGTITLYFDNNNDGLLDGGDTAVPISGGFPYLDEVVEDDVIELIAVGDIPLARADGDVAVVRLTAVAAMNTTTTTMANFNGVVNQTISGVYSASPAALAADAVETNGGSADDVTYIDNVFGEADADGAGANDAQYDGRHFDEDDYTVVTATITVTKSSTVVSDPFGSTNPKAVPGAIIEYCIDVQNTGTGTAQAIIISDDVPDNTLYDDDSYALNTGSIRSAATGTGTACDVGSGTAEDDDNADGGEPLTDPTADYGATVADFVTVRTPSIPGGSRFKATFRVVVQ